MKLLFSLLALAFLCQDAAATYCCDFGTCCVSDFDRCDGIEECITGCDEDGCSSINIVGIAVGVSIAGFILLIVLPITICVCIWCCVAGAAANAGSTHTTYVTRTPVAQPGMTVVTSNQQTSGGTYYPAPQPGNRGPPQYAPY